MSKQVIGTNRTTDAAGPLAITVVIAVAAAVLAVLAVGAGASQLGPRLGVRNTVYALLAAALLIAVLVDAVHHRLAHEHDIDQLAATAASSTAASSMTSLFDGDELTHGSLLAELQLAARLGAELMGEVPASRTGRDPATFA